MISTELAEKVAARVAELGLNEANLFVLRDEFPEIHFTYCMEDDITAGKPFLEKDGFNIYLVDSRSHCLSITNNSDIATGIVLAEVIDD